MGSPKTCVSRRGAIQQLGSREHQRLERYLSRSGARISLGRRRNVVIIARLRTLSSIYGWLAHGGGSAQSSIQCAADAVVRSTATESSEFATLDVINSVLLNSHYLTNVYPFSTFSSVSYSLSFPSCGLGHVSLLIETLNRTTAKH